MASDQLANGVWSRVLCGGGDFPCWFGPFNQVALTRAAVQIRIQEGNTPNPSRDAYMAFANPPLGWRDKSCVLRHSECREAARWGPRKSFERPYNFLQPAPHPLCYGAAKLNGGRGLSNFVRCIPRFSKRHLALKLPRSAVVREFEATSGHHRGNTGKCPKPIYFSTEEPFDLFFENWPIDKLKLSPPSSTPRSLEIWE